MSKRKPKPIDEQGHDPAPGVVPSRIDCRRCCDCRIKDHDWKRPCPPSASGRETKRLRKAMADAAEPVAVPA